MRPVIRTIPSTRRGGLFSGSAAAVADGQVPVSIGTQTAGSTIRPASYCGVLGYKPTFALISRAGILNQSRRLDTVGIFSRSLADMAIVADELMRFDPTDVDMSPFGPLRLHEALGTKLLRPPKFIFFETPQWRDASSVGQQKFMDIIKRLEGYCDIKKGPTGFDVTNQMQRMIQYSDIATNFGKFYDEAPGKIAPEIVEIIRNGRMNSAVDYVRAVNQREPIYATVKSYLSQYDAIVCPSAGNTAPVGYSTGATPDFCAPWTYLGMPVINVPALDIEGMPFGIQLIGLRGGDRNLFRAAKWFQDRID